MKFDLQTLFGFDSSWHIPFVSHLSKVLQPECYVEIGIYEASTFNRVSKHAKFSIGIDVNPKAGEFIKSKDAKFACGTNALLRFIMSTYRKQKIDLAFIDGDHKSGQVLADFSEISKFATDECLILIHDTWPQTLADTAENRCADSFQVPKMIQEFTNGDWSAITIPNHPGLTITQRSNIRPTWMV